MLNPASLGTDNLKDLVNLLKAKEDTIIGEFLIPKVTSKLEPGSVEKLKGLTPYLPAGQQMGSEKDEEEKEQGYNAATPMIELEISDRKYRIRRIARKASHNTKMTKDKIYDKVKDEYIPTLTRKIQTTADLYHLAPILKGQGLAAESRDVTTIDLAAERWDGASSNILGRLQDAVKATGADLMVMGYDVMQAVQRNDELTSASAGSGTTILTEPQIVSWLSAFLGVPEIIVGNRGYQGGAPTFALNLKYAMDGVAYVGRKDNLVHVPWDVEGIDWTEFEDEDVNAIYTKGEYWFDLITYDPAFSIAFQNVLTAA